jgi:hypothetical protein
MSTSVVALRKLTPPDIARAWGIGPDKVLVWIRSGELPAINAATRQGGRPRYLVDAADLAAFEARRASRPRVTARHRKRKHPGHVIEFF